jgi:DNA-binding NarL/FixJ family response regulator
MIRVGIVHKSRMVASLLASAMADEPDILVVGYVHTEKEALALVNRSGCDIAIIDAQLDDQTALRLTRELFNSYPAVKVLIMGLHEHKRLILQYIMAGAAGYVLEELPAASLLASIRALYSDRALITPEMAAVLMKQVAKLAHGTRPAAMEPIVYDQLTPRELEVLELVADGFTNREIAKQLVIEVGTVKNHVHSILSKLDESSREDAAAHLPFIRGHGGEEES